MYIVNGMGGSLIGRSENPKFLVVHFSKTLMTETMNKTPFPSPVSWLLGSPEPLSFFKSQKAAYKVACVNGESPSNAHLASKSLGLWRNEKGG